MLKNYSLILLLTLFSWHQSQAQCPTLSASIVPTCNGGVNGAINLSVSGDTANISNPGLLISEIHTDPPLADSPKEWVELVATRTINFTLTPYTVIFSNNGRGTSKGWVEGNIPTPPPRNSTYAFLIDSGTVQAGDVVYVGGTAMAPTGVRLRQKNTSTENGDGGIGGAFTGATGVLGNGGGVADGIAVFNLPISQIDSNTVPVDAIFYGAGVGDAALADTSRGFRLPVNDRYAGGRLKSSSFLAPEVFGFYSLQASGSYNTSTGIYTLPRTWSTNNLAWTSATTSLSLSGNTYLWSNGATTKNISGLSAGNYSVTVTSSGCTVNGTYIVTQPNPLTVNLTPSPAICNGTNNGSISSAVNADTPPYSYAWSTGATTTALSGLTAGTYTLTVTDANGCSTTQSASIVQIPAIIITSITPNTHSAGYPVKISGSGLADITQVKFNGVNATSFTLSGDTLVNANVPVNANSGTIELVNNAGCTAQSATAFTYLFSNPNLTVKLYLQGLYISGGFMEPPLVNSGLSGNSEAADSVELLLASANTPHNIVHSGRVLLLTSGVSVLNLPGTVIGQQYYIVVRHRNSVETWSKQPVTFSANTYYNFSGVQQFPEVATTALPALTGTVTVSGGTIISDGGSAVTARGVCWSTSPGPTVALTTKTIDGTGTGSFNSTISGLAPNATYYVRAYAINAVGTSYGNEISFTTMNLSPVDNDGNTYDFVVIGTQVWMSENLHVSKYRNGDPIPTNLSDGIWQNTSIGAYAIYDNIPVNDSIYGKLYNWYAVADPRGLCPTGWHVPSNADWNTLENYLGGFYATGYSLSGGMMKALSPLWFSPNTGATNSSGFSGLPGGLRYNEYGDIGLSGLWWSSSEHSTNSAWYRRLNCCDIFLGTSINYKQVGSSVRCVLNDVPILNTTALTAIASTAAYCGGDITDAGLDAVNVRGVVWSTAPNPTVALTTKTSDGSGNGSYTSTMTGLNPNTTYYVRAYATNGMGTGYGDEISFTTTAGTSDIDGNFYNTVVIGSQEWIADNLKVSKYRNGDPIPTNLNDASWQGTTDGAYAIYDNIPVNDSLYGKLYNWYAVADPRGLCPAGWHVPGDAEWETLENFLGGSSVAGGKMKAVSSLWLAPNTDATNSSGFTGLPGGYRNAGGAYYFIGYFGFWWSSTQFSTTSAWYRDLFYFDGDVRRNNDPKRLGFSVRCVRD
jgi:uncharacterized protein (TIGR02145 family)